MNADQEKTFEQFVDTSGPRLLGAALVLTAGDRGAAEDLLQQALVKVARRWQHITDEPERYTRTALSRLATDRWRRSRVRVAEVTDDGFDHLDVVAADQLAGIEVRDALWAVLRQLPPRQRAVIVLRYLDDLTETETANALGIPVGTVKSAHSRALTRLRDLLPADPSKEVAR